MHLTTLSLLRIAVIFTLGMHGVSGQVATIAATSQTAVSSEPAAASSDSTPTLSQQQTTVATYRAAQATLGSSYIALVQSGASTQQIHQWEKNHATEVKALAQQAQAMSLSAASQPLPVNGTTRIPADNAFAASSFLAGRAALAKAFASNQQAAKQRLGISTGTMTAAQEAQVAQIALGTFVQQNKAALALQRERTTTLTTAGDQTLPALRASPVIPAGASPQLTAFLNARSQLREAYAQFLNQYGTAAPAVRITALAQWRKQNASLMQELQSPSANLVQSATAKVGGN